MGNIIDYIHERGDLSLEQFAFNEVDSLILSQLAYLNYAIVSNFPCVFKELPQLASCEHLSENLWNASCSLNLIQAVASSKRFGNIVIDCYTNVTDLDHEKQFCAVTYHLSESLHYIAYRGTVASLIGWKENFNLSFSENVPSQHSALEYLEQIFSSFEGLFLLGGHSKGGNLAVYAAVMANEEIQQKILSVYNHDGPGFLPEVFASDAFQSISPRIHKTVPQTAIVGLLLERHECYSVVASNSFVILQHDPFSWVIENGAFVIIEEVDSLSKYTNRTINAWLNSVDIDTRRVFIDTLYDVISATNVDSFSELTSSGIANIRPVFDSIRTTDPQVRKLIHQTIAALIKAAASEMKNFITEKITS